MQKALHTTEAENMSLSTALRDAIPLMLMTREIRESSMMTFIVIQLMSTVIDLRTSPITIQR